MSSSTTPQPTAIRAPHGADHMEIAWPGLSRPDRLPNEILRGYCPCAGCQGHSGEINFQSGNDSELRDLSVVGNYALNLTWGDGHSTGIYTYAYLRLLGQLLEAHGPDGLIALGRIPKKP